jgi:uncharacterized membrane protein YGL010W
MFSSTITSIHLLEFNLHTSPKFLCKFPMRNLEQQITQYAAYHRDRRNIATHFVGVPMIVFSVVLALVPWVVGGINVALIAIGIASVYYLILDRSLGTAMLLFLFVCYLIAITFNAAINARGGHAGFVLAAAALLFIVGWVIQFVGHKYEGMKPAFTDDIMGLIIGPLFIMTEVFFVLGLKATLKKYVEDRVGPVLAARNGAPIGPVSSPTGDAANA